MNKRIAAAAAAALLTLAACGGGEDKSGVPTAEENAQLDNAADMLDTTPDNLVPVENDAAAGEGAAMDTVDANEAADAENTH